MDQYRDILSTLASSKRVLVTTHVRPDGDALGSTAAMVLALRHKGIDAKVLLLSHLPTKYSFIYADLGIEWIDVEKGFPADFSLQPYDALLVVDRDVAALAEGDQNLIDPHARGADEIGEIGLGQAQRDDDVATGRGAVDLGEGQQLASHAAVDIQRRQLRFGCGNGAQRLITAPGGEQGHQQFGHGKGRQHGVEEGG